MICRHEKEHEGNQSKSKMFGAAATWYSAPIALCVPYSELIIIILQALNENVNVSKILINFGGIGVCVCHLNKVEIDLFGCRV